MTGVTRFTHPDVRPLPKVPRRPVTPLDLAQTPGATLEQWQRCWARFPNAHAWSDPTGRTVLMALAFHGPTEALRLALHQPGADLEATDHLGRRALHGAALAGDPERLALLLPGSDPCALTLDGESAVLLACSQPARSACLDLLLAHAGPRMVAVADRFGVTPLMRAASQGDAAMIARLLPHSDPNATDHRGHSALRRAVDHGHPDVVRALLLAPPPTMNGWETPGLMGLAARRETPDVLRLLLSTASPRPQDALQALSHAVRSERSHNAHLLTQALDPALVLAHLEQEVGPMIGPLKAATRARERRLLTQGSDTPSLPPRARARL